jgi:adenylyltransferase/sulfurtransferase
VDTKLDLVQLAGSLGKLGEVEDNGYLLIFRIDGYEITIFPNGRAMVKGTTETQVARSLYSRYVGI